MAAAALLPRSGRLADDVYRGSTGSESRVKRGRKKTVSWPSIEKLCEVRLFLAEDTPAFTGLNQLGSKAFSNDHPLGKRPRLEPMSGDDCSGSSYLVARQPVVNPKMDMCMKPGCQWHHPLKFVLDDSWLVAGGDESTEVSAENQREIRVLEAFYPRFTTIPDSPAEPQNCVNLHDARVPLVPLEEVKVVSEEAVLEETYGAETLVNHISNHESAVQRDIVGSEAEPCRNGEQADVIGIADPNIAAVAAAACMTVNAWGEGDLVDQDLLVELLRNPSLIKSLTLGNHTVNGQNHTLSSKSSIQDRWLHSCNASPVSVLTNWGEETPSQSSQCSSPSSETTSISSVMQHPRHPRPTTGTAIVGAIASKKAPNHLPFSSRSPLQQGQTRVQIGPLIQCCDYDLQASSLGPDSRSTSEARTLPYQPSQPSTSNLHLMQAVSAPMHSHPVSNNEASLRATRRDDKWTTGRRVGEDNKTRRLQRKCTILGDPLKAGSRNQRLCIYFNTPKGCRKGVSCAFLHTSLNPEMNTVAG